MGVYNTTTITSTNFEQRVSSLTNYLNNLNGVSASESTIEYDSNEYSGALFGIDGTGIQGFYGYYYDDIQAKTSVIVWLNNGSAVLIEPNNGLYSGIQDLRMDSYIDEKCIILYIRDNSSKSDGLELMLVDVNNASKLIGYAEINSGNPGFVDISELAFENMDDSVRTPYTYTNMFPYRAAVGTVDFLGQSYFVNGGIRRYTCEFMKECSTVSLLSTVSLPSPLNNYLAIGAHCLAPLDDEGGNE